MIDIFDAKSYKTWHMTCPYLEFDVAYTRPTWRTWHIPTWNEDSNTGSSAICETISACIRELSSLLRLLWPVDFIGLVTNYASMNESWKEIFKYIGVYVSDISFLAGIEPHSKCAVVVYFSLKVEPNLVLSLVTKRLSPMSRRIN